MVVLKNEFLEVQIATAGAEIKSIKNSVMGIEYIWRADAAYWGRSTPTLFPIVGKLKDNTMYVDGTEFKMGQHGFARDLEFLLEAETANSATFLLKETDATLGQYPFAFRLKITYILNDADISVQWEVENPDVQQPLPFSIGAHPAFSTRLFDADSIEDYYLEFDKEISIDAWRLTENGQFGDTTQHFGVSDSLRLSADLFSEDAIVLKTIPFRKVSLRNIKNGHGVEMDLSNFVYKNEQPLIAFWSANIGGADVPFVCLEPWFGHADLDSGPFEISQKSGIIQLGATEKFKTEYRLRFF